MRLENNANILNWIYLLQDLNEVCHIKMSSALNSSSIRNFQTNMHNAMCMLEGLPSLDLITAFRITLNLLERIAEIMQNQLLLQKTDGMNGSLIDPNHVTSLLTNCLERNDSLALNGESQINTNKSQIPPPNKLRINKRKQMPFKLQSPSTSKRFMTSFNKEDIKIEDNLSDNNSSNFENPNCHALSQPIIPGAASDSSPKCDDFSQDVEVNHRQTSPHSSDNNEVDVTGIDTSDGPLSIAQTQESLSTSEDTDVKLETGGDLRSQYERRQWRMFTSDKLNQLIDECEKVLDGKKIYKCKFCGKLYDIKSSMRYHMKIIHLQMHLRTDDMQCKNCGKRFTCVSAVNRHHAKCLLNNNTTTTTGHSKSHISPITTLPSEANTNGSPSSSIDVKVRHRNEEDMLGNADESHLTHDQYDTESPVDLSHSSLQHVRF